MEVVLSYYFTGFWYIPAAPDWVVQLILPRQSWGMKSQKICRIAVWFSRTFSSSGEVGFTKNRFDFSIPSDTDRSWKDMFELWEESPQIKLDGFNPKCKWFGNHWKTRGTEHEQWWIIWLWWCEKNWHLSWFLAPSHLLRRWSFWLSWYANSGTTLQSKSDRMSVWKVMARKWKVSF